MPTTPDDATATMIANYEKNTGKPFVAWLSLVRERKLSKHGEIVALLKQAHGMGHGYANLVAKRALQTATPASADADVDAQYAGAKGALRPIYEALARAVASFGDDVEFAPKKSYVSLRRHKQFGLIQPSTADRLDVGLNLKGVAPTTRLEAAGSFNAMVTHRVRVGGIAEVDAPLVRWLRAAYDAA